MRKEINLEYATRIINHGPVLMVSSMHYDRTNITPVAWNMPIQKKPPVIALEIGEKHFIFECIMETGDFAVNILSKEYVGDIVKCGRVSGRDEDKFKITSFTKRESKKITSSSLEESLAILECKLVKDDYLLKEYNIVLGEVKYAEALEEAFTDHWDFKDDKYSTIHHLGNKTFCFPGKEIVDLR